MKKKTFGLITTGKSNYSLQRILDEAKILDFDPIIFDVNNLMYKLYTEYPCDFVINRSTALGFDDLDLAIISDFESRNIKCHNSLSSFTNLRNKDRQLIELKNKKLNPPPSLFLRGAINEEGLIEMIKTWQKDNGDFQKDTYILKSQRGNKGIGVNLIRGRDSLISILETFWGMRDQRFILQPYIPHKKEYRLFFLKNSNPIFIEKSNPQDFRINAQRATTTYIENTADLKFEKMTIMATKAAQAFDLSYAGFDFFEANSGELYLCEVNPIPGFENIEKLTGKNIARELLITF